MLMSLTVLSRSIVAGIEAGILTQTNYYNVKTITSIEKLICISKNTCLIVYELKISIQFLSNIHLIIGLYVLFCQFTQSDSTKHYI